MAHIANQSPNVSNFDFVALSNIEKHLIHLQEGCEALMETCAAACIHHKDYFLRRHVSTRDYVIDATQDALEHKHTLLKSITLQAASKEKRLHNLTSLVGSYLLSLEYPRTN